MSARRRIAWAVAALAAVAIAAVAGVGWYYAGEINREAFVIDYAPPKHDLVVAAVGDGTVTLSTTETTDIDYGPWRQPGLWSLEWDGGTGEVGDIVSEGSGEVVRRFTALSGAPAEGAAAVLRGTVYDGDPQTALGLPFTDVTIAGEGGPLAAWQIAGTSRTWAILVHGKGQTREEMLRYLPAFTALDMPCLVITYRNDEGAFASASGRYDYGASEWRDLEAAVGFALDQGADDVVLFGASMGGSIAMAFLYQSDLADRVKAVVMDAPMLSFGDTVDFGAERRGLPRALTWIGKTAATLRYGFSWQDAEFVTGADQLDVPILIFHGDADRLVHIRTSEALAAARPDIVTLVRLPGLAHVRAWNIDPAAFDRTVAEFLVAAGVR